MEKVYIDNIRGKIFLKGIHNYAGANELFENFTMF